MINVDMKIEKREKKFRAWDKFQNTMTGLEYDEENIGILPSCDKTGTTMYHSNGSIILINISYDGYDIMEFTGKYDKNKKEIYEFDIVKWKGIPDGECVKKNDEILGLVVWSKDICGFIIEQLTEGNWINEIGDCTFKYDTEFYSREGQEFLWEDVEIVGNKYHNPDLLKNSLLTKKLEIAEQLEMEK